jgi:hypothetical protein
MPLTPKLSSQPLMACVANYLEQMRLAHADLAQSAPTAQATLSGCSCQAEHDLQGLGDAVPQTMGPDTARHLARYAIHAAQLAPKLYSPASAMDQVLEAASPGLSKKVTAKASAMMLKGVMPQTALEEAITESFVELAPKYPKYPKYPKVPQQPALNGLGTTTTTTYTGRAATMRGAGSLISDAGGAISALITGITDAVVSVREQQSTQEQQSFDRRMAQLESDRRAAEDAALREAGGLPLQVGGGGIGLGTILLVGLGLATAGGAIYYVTKKK